MGCETLYSTTNTVVTGLPPCVAAVQTSSTCMDKTGRISRQLQYCEHLCSTS